MSNPEKANIHQQNQKLLDDYQSTSKYLHTPLTFHSLTHLISQYFWLIFIVSFSYFGITNVPYQKSGDINSTQIINKWDDDKNPSWFGVITDVHLNSLDSATNPHCYNALSALSNLSVDDLLILGDLVDNWGETIFSKYGHQYEQDYILYNQTFKKYESHFKNIIDLAGNHDEFGIYSVSSNYHHFLDHSRFFKRATYSTERKFWASTFESDDFIFILLNPYRYPAPHAKFDYFVRPTTAMLDSVQEEIDKHKKAEKPVVVACHYPMYFWLNTSKSSKKKTLIDIVKESNVHLYLSGHIHPSVSVFEHHNGFLEIAVSDVKEHSNFGICAFDNGRPSFHTYKNLSDAKIILTHPIPVHEMTCRSPFIERDTSIRLLVFGDKDKKIKVRGAVEGQLKYQREIKPNVYLYSLPISLDNGYHNLEFYGDWKYEMEFYVGPQIPSFPERRYGSTNLFNTAIIYSFIFFVVNLFILFPFPLFIDNVINTTNHLLVALFSGFLDVRFRISLLPRWLRYELFFACLAPLFFPISFVEDEGHLGMILVYGYYFNWTFVYDIWGQLICGVYELSVVLMITLFASGLAVSNPWHHIIFIDCIVGFGGFFYGVYFLNTAVMEASGPFLTNISPLFIFIPIILLFSIIFRRIFSAGDFFRVGRNLGASKKVN